MSNGSWKKAGAIILGLLLLAGLLAFLLYLNREDYIPKIKEVTYLKAALDKDTARVQAGIQVQNQAPVPFTIDSINYQIQHKSNLVGWGSHLVKERLPASEVKTLDIGLFIDIDRYQKQLALQKGHDSLHLDVLMKVYIDPPFLNQQVITINRTITTALPKGPAIKIDSLVVKNFSPDAGYTFELNLNTENTDLPVLQIENLQYRFRISDSLLISGKIDSTFRIKKGARSVAVPIHLETSEMLELLLMKLGKQKKWPYEAHASAIVKTAHPLFAHTNVSLEKSGLVDTRKLGGSTVAMPKVKQVQSLQLISKSKFSYLQAKLLINNPTLLPLYLDSARYFVHHKGKIVAHGGKDHEQVFPAKQNKSLQLQLTINNSHYDQIMQQAEGKNNISLDAEVLLYYNLKGSKPQQISVKKTISMPVTKEPGFKVTNFGIKQLDPKKGAQLFAKLEIKSQNSLQIEDLQYQVAVDKNIEITGQIRQLINLDTGTTEIEIPVDLSATHANLLAKGLMEGKERWDYTFGGTATISAQNSMLQQTEVTIQTSGVFNINSKGTPDYMPEISKIDTLHVTMRYDTAWVHMYAAIYNTLPVAVNITRLQVDVIHENDTIGHTEEKLKLTLVPNSNTFAWHTLGVNYGEWEQHLEHHQHEDSILLLLPTKLFVELGNLGTQQIQLNLETRMPSPTDPFTLLRKMPIRGFSFREGLKFDVTIAVQNANSAGLTVKNIDYLVTLENGVDMRGKINRTFEFPIGISEVQIPVNLSVWESIKMAKRQLLGPALIDYKINATAQLRTDNPKLSDVYLIFENHNQTNLQEKKPPKSTLQP